MGSRRVGKGRTEILPVRQARKDISLDELRLRYDKN